MIEADKLHKLFGTFTAVREISLNVADGEVVALLGPNGAGKTTTVRMLAAILKPTSGRARIAGYDVVDVHPIVLEPQAGHYVRASGPWKSVRLVLRKGDASTTVDYVSVDLSDGFLNQNQGAREWLANMSRNPILLKAASHLLQMPSFTVLRDILANNVTMVVQDETGLDYSVLSRIGNVELYGNFLYPHELFNRNRQASLAAAYKASKTVKPLPFAFSYNKTNERRALQVVRRGTVAQ